MPDLCHGLFLGCHSTEIHLLQIRQNRDDMRPVSWLVLYEVPMQSDGVEMQQFSQLVHLRQTTVVARARGLRWKKVL